MQQSHSPTHGLVPTHRPAAADRARVSISSRYSFGGKYKGKKDEFKGHYAIYFDRKNSFYLELNLSAYGCDQDWVIINKTK